MSHAFVQDARRVYVVPGTRVAEGRPHVLIIQRDEHQGIVVGQHGRYSGPLDFAGLAHDVQTVISR